MTSLFLDTSYLIAVQNADDQYHKTASKHWRDLLKSSPRLVTSSYVFVEVVTLLNNRSLHSKAVELGNNLLSSAYSMSFTSMKNCFMKPGIISRNIKTK